MENLSQPVETIAIPLAIPVPAYLRDHHVAGRVVLPAVEALQILARYATGRRPAPIPAGRSGRVSPSSHDRSRGRGDPGDP